MSFRTIGVGYLIEEHGDFSDYLQLVCEQVRDKKGKAYGLDNIDELFTEFENNKIYDFHDFFEKYEVVLYADIDYNGSELCYKQNNRFIIGKPHCCCTMIYISSSEDEDEYESQFFTNDELVELMAWTDKLKKEERLKPDSQFAIVPNCCT